MTESLRPRPGTRLAYGISAVTTLLWFASVLPAGPLVTPGLSEDLATPMHREAWLLVPALLVLVIGPAGIVLSQGRAGRMAVLAATDAFLAGYAGLALLPRVDVAAILDGLRNGAVEPWRWVQAGLVAMMLVLAVLSASELLRILVRGPDHAVSPMLRGLRLALCLFVLVIPSWMLLAEGQRLAPLLLPFLFVGVSSLGAAFGQAPLALRMTASAVHTMLAVFVVLVLRATLFETPPFFARIGVLGWATVGLALLVLALALTQVVRIGVKSRREAAAMPAGVESAPSRG